MAAQFGAIRESSAGRTHVPVGRCWIADSARAQGATTTPKQGKFAAHLRTIAESARVGSQRKYMISHTLQHGALEQHCRLLFIAAARAVRRVAANVSD